MTDLGNGRGATQTAAAPTPSCIRPRRLPGEQAAFGMAAPVMPAMPAIALAAGQSGRATAREELRAALAGVTLGSRDRQFLGKLVHWDKRNAASVVSLLRRARQAGRDEAALTPRQMETVLAALGDAARHRSAGLGAVGCWDCENVPAGRCAEHVRDDERARAYAELAAVLAAPTGRADGGLTQPRDIAGYRRRRPVAS
jgi:hypothetical protein